MPRLPALLLAAVAAAVPVAALPVVAASPVQAASQQAAAPLNGPTIEAFIESIPAIRLWTDRHQDTARQVAPTVLKPQALAGNPFAMMVEGLRGTAAYSDLDSAVGRHGFENPEDWAGVANRVTKALGVMALDRQGADNPLRAAERELDTNPDITPQDRTMLKGLLLAVSMFAQAPKEDVQAVTPYTDQIVAALQQRL
ncbi:hypothetical protein [Caenispirillum bisanense]|uniref:hypothetical protein n=1 Tax=Caenispirillum bisanense TaxID=414052 RepID=UPI0031CEF6DD